MPRNKGVDLGAPYNTDMDGNNSRGADGAWDIGGTNLGPRARRRRPLPLGHQCRLQPRRQARVQGPTPTPGPNTPIEAESGNISTPFTFWVATFRKA